MFAVDKSPYSPTAAYPSNTILDNTSSEPGVERVQLDIGFNVWTKRVGNGPIKVLMLHGGPGLSHKYLEPSFSTNLPLDQYELIFYDQLGSYNSDKPTGPDARHLWSIERFLNEVEQVIERLSLDQFILFGHSWGGLLAIEYALKHPERLKGLIVASMTASVESYVAYLNKLRAELPPSVQEELKAYEDKGKFEDPAYEQLLFKQLYCKHICRLDQWPEEAMESMQHLNKEVLNEIQGPNEFIFNGNAGNWSRWNDLKDIATPTLIISGRYDHGSR